jgi:hypothetical protein
MRNKIIVIIDICLMVLLILLGVINNIPYSFFPFCRLLFYVLYLYILVKCILGILILMNKLFKKDKILHSWKYSIFLIPSVSLTIFYIYILCILPAKINYLGNIRLVLYKIVDGFSLWFPSLEVNIILIVAIMVGNLMWLIYWSFYNQMIKMPIIIILNILSPISILMMFYRILYIFDFRYFSH